MSVNSDISQLSGISGISIISCSSSVQQQQQQQQPPPYKEYTLDKTLNDLAKCEDSICQMATLRLIHECLESVATAEDNHITMTPELLNKLKDILLAHSIEKYFRLPSKGGQNEDKLTLLGIMEIPRPELSREEKATVKSAVELQLLNRINSFLSRYENCGGNLIEAMGSNESSARQKLSKCNESILPHWKNKIDDMCNEYYRDIFICFDLLCEWRKLKHEDIEELNLRKAQSKLLQAEIAEIQARLTKMTCAIKMFKETPITAKAFKILNEIVDQKMTEIQAEVKRKKGLLCEYENLRGTEYDDILRRYLDLCSTIEKDERLLNSL